MRVALFGTNAVKKNCHGSKLLGTVAKEPGDHVAALSAFRIVDVPIIAARNKDVRERVVFGFHRRKL